jgi:GxxExxY protein
MERDEGEIRKLCDLVRETAYSLHVFLRHGHLEKVYENGLANRLRKVGLGVEQQSPLNVFDEDGTVLGNYYADLFIENMLIVELKACSGLTSSHVAQVLGYLRASNRRDAMLINFGTSRFSIRKFIL